MICLYLTILLFIVIAWSYLRFFFFLSSGRPPRPTPLYSSAASEVYKRQRGSRGDFPLPRCWACHTFWRRAGKWGRRGSQSGTCLLYTSPSPRDRQKSRMPSSAWKKKISLLYTQWEHEGIHARSSCIEKLTGQRYFRKLTEEQNDPSRTVILLNVTGVLQKLSKHRNLKSKVAICISYQLKIMGMVNWFT